MQQKSNHANHKLTMASSSDADADGGGVELRPLVRSTSPPVSPRTPRSILPHTPVDLHPRRPPPVAVDLEDIDHTFADNETLLEAEAKSQKAGGHGHGHGGGPGGSTPRQTVINIFSDQVAHVAPGQTIRHYVLSRCCFVHDCPLSIRAGNGAGSRGDGIPVAGRRD